MSDGIVVKKSKIHGFGIFAKRDFRKDEAIIRWKDYKVLNREDIEKLTKKDKNHLSYVNKEYVLVPPEGRVNHSCDPNVVLINFCYVAKRDIKKGEEITADYVRESDPGFEMKCNCGSKKCRGIIRA